MLVCCFCGRELEDDVVEVDLVRADRRLGAYLAHLGCEADYRNPNYAEKGTGVKYYLRPAEAIRYSNMASRPKRRKRKGDGGLETDG